MTRTYLKRLAESVLATFGGAFLAIYTFGDQSTLKAAAFAGLGAVAKLLYGLIVRYFGDTDSPTVL